MFPSLNAIEIQKPNIETEAHNESENLFPAANSRQSHTVASVQSNWNKMVVSALELASNVNPYCQDLPAGTVVRAIDAVGWSVNHRNCDHT